MKTEVIKIILADDHDLIREGLKRIISFEENLKILGEAKNGEEALNLVELFTPTVVLLDLIIDTAVNFNDNTLCALDNSSLILYVSTMKIVSLKNTKL